MKWIQFQLAKLLVVVVSFSYILPEDLEFFGKDFYVNLSLAVVYLNSFSMFILNRLCLRLLEPQPDERISFVRNLFHLLVSPLVIIGYSLVEFWSIQELAIRGKEVCNHKPSKKTDLIWCVRWKEETHTAQCIEWV